MKGVMIWFDDEGNASQFTEIHSVHFGEENPIIFGERFEPTKNIEFSISPVNVNGEPNLIQNVIYRKQDMNMKFIESKKDFKARELATIVKYIKKRSKR